MGHSVRHRLVSSQLFFGCPFLHLGSWAKYVDKEHTTRTRTLVGREKYVTFTISKCNGLKVIGPPGYWLFTFLSVIGVSGKYLSSDDCLMIMIMMVTWNDDFNYHWFTLGVLFLVQFKNSLAFLSKQSNVVKETSHVLANIVWGKCYHLFIVRPQTARTLKSMWLLEVTMLSSGETSESFQISSLF